MQDKLIRRVVILGGGSSGWMTAAALAKSIQRDCQITLVESRRSAPWVSARRRSRRSDSSTRCWVWTKTSSCAAPKARSSWASALSTGVSRGTATFTRLGSYGRPFDLVQIQHFWQRAWAQGKARPLDDHCMAWAMAKAERFAPPMADPRHVLSTFDYAYHFDAGLYARCLREYAEARGVKRVEGKVRSVQQNATTGHIEGLTLDSGEQVMGELFIDCSGLRALLIEDTLHTGFEDWSHWLPCDRAIAVPSETGAFSPYTLSTAHTAGWQWRIPLQHRTGNGHVFSSAFMGEDEAQRILLAHLDGAPLAEPRLIKFKTGRRRQCWNKNVIAIGLSSAVSGAARIHQPAPGAGRHLQTAGVLSRPRLRPSGGA